MAAMNAGAGLLAQIATALPVKADDSAEVSLNAANSPEQAAAGVAAGSGHILGAEDLGNLAATCWNALEASRKERAKKR